MGIAARKRRHESRQKAKKARKAAKAALYKSYAEKGSGRRKKKLGLATHLPFNHEIDNCGNVGCKKCYPVVNKVPGSVA